WLSQPEVPSNRRAITPAQSVADVRGSRRNRSDGSIRLSLTLFLSIYLSLTGEERNVAPAGLTGDLCPHLGGAAQRPREVCFAGARHPRSPSGSARGSRARRRAAPRAGASPSPRPPSCDR